MRLVVRHIVEFLGFSCIVASMAACGGTKQEAKAPSPTEVSTPQGGSAAPDPTPPIDKTGKTETPSANATASASTKDDGSDIIPPFPSAAKDKDSPKRASAKAEKKSRKPRKKG